MIVVCGPSLKAGTAKIKTTFQYLLRKLNVQNKGMFKLWHDVVHNSISPHRSNYYNTLSGRKLGKWQNKYHLRKNVKVLSTNHR